MNTPSSGRGAFEFQDGESFNGAVARWADGVWVERMLHVTKAAGISSQARHSASGGSEAQVRALAAEMDVDAVELLARAMPYLGNEKDGQTWRSFQGLRLPAALIENKVRRYSPAALAGSEVAYHRALWDLRLLPVCMETGQPLLDRCQRPLCNGQTRVGWQRTRGITTCEHCMTELTDSYVEAIDADLLMSIQPVAGLFDARCRAMTLKYLPEELRADGGQLAVDMLLRLLQVVDPRMKKHPNGLHRADPADACRALAAAWTVMVGWPDAFNDLALDRLLERTRRHDDGNSGETLRFLKLKAAGRTTQELAGLVARVRRSIDLDDPDGYATCESTCTTDEAARILSTGTAEVATFRRRRAVSTILVLDGGRLQPMFDRTEIMTIATGIADRRGFDYIASRLGISHHGVEQLADRRLIEVQNHPFFMERYAINQSTGTSYNRFLDDMQASSSVLQADTDIPLIDVVKAIGGRAKPWGPIFEAMLRGSVAYTINPGTGTLLQRIRVRSVDARKLVALVFQPTTPTTLPFAKKISKLDAIETLNLSYRQGTELFANVTTARGSRTKSLDVADVLTLATRYITPGEIAARTGGNAASIYAAGVRAGLVMSSRAGFERDDAERLFIT